jgi:hypothetical protein
MTFVEVTYDLPAPLKPEQLRALGLFANTYGLRRIHVNEQTNQICVEYDGSRLTETEVAHVLGKARILASRRV